MNEHKKDKKIIARITNLARQRESILSLPPEKALDAILDVPHAAALVQSFSEDDFYFLIHDIGIEDSHPLLRLASNRQWEYIVDLEAWEKDRIELASVTRWFDLLFKTDPNRFIKWFLDQKTEFMEFYLFKNIELKIRETDQDPSDFGDDFFSFDDTFYLKFTDEPIQFESEARKPDKTGNSHRDAFLTKFLIALAAYDHVTFQKVLLESSKVIPSETEEETYRLRNVRLAEKGFLPYEKAVGIYQPMKACDFEKQPTKFTTDEPGRKLFLPVPLYHSGMIEQETPFTDALKRIKTDDLLEQIQIEFAGLCNLIVSADQKTIRDRDDLKHVVKKACAYLNIGLEKLIENKGEPKSNHCEVWIRKYPLSSIFKVGFGLGLELKWQAEKWLKKSWFERKGLLLGFWDEKWMGVLGGLLIKKPMFYDSDKADVLYREFYSLKDIKKTEKVLNEIIAVDELLSMVGIEPQLIEQGYLTYKSFVLTLWARHHLGLTEEPLPLALDAFKPFFNDLWFGKEIPRKTRPAMKESFLSWVADRTGLTHHEITQKLGRTLENLFNEIESEYGAVADKDLDFRFIQLFLIKQ